MYKTSAVGEANDISSKLVLFAADQEAKARTLFADQDYFVHG